MPHHGLDRHRDVSGRWRRRADADQERRHGDVSRQGRGQERLPVLLQGDQDAVDRAADAGNRAAPCAGAQRVLAALPAQGRHRDRPDHRRRGAAALEASGTRHAAAGAVHSACRGDRADRADRPLGAEGSLRAEHGLAAPGLPPVSMAVNLSPRQFVDANLLQDVDEALLPAACRRCCCSSRSPRAW